MNRTGEKGQPCRSPTCTGNRSDLLPAMRTRPLHQSYRDRTALSRGTPTPYHRSTSHRMPRMTWSNTFSQSTKHVWTGAVPECHMMLQGHVSQDSPTISRDLRYSGWISSTPGALPLRSFPTISVTSAWVINESTSESPASASSTEGASVGLRRSSKYFFHHPTRSPFELPTSTVKTWNVTSLGVKKPELVREVERYRLEIVGFTSMRTLGSGTHLHFIKP